MHFAVSLYCYITQGLTLISFIIMLYLFTLNVFFYLFIYLFKPDNITEYNMHNSKFLQSIKTLKIKTFIILLTRFSLFISCILSNP